MDDSFFDKGSRETEFSALSITLTILAAVAVGLRFFCRYITSVKFWWDDWLILGALIPDIALLVVIELYLKHYIGHHVGQVDFININDHFGKPFWYSELAYISILALAKFSILTLYWRIFSKAARWPMLVMGALVGAWSIASFLVALFQCNPISDAWQWQVDTTQTCIDTKKFLIAPSIPNIITDFFILLIPLPYIFRLHMRLAQQILLMGIFLLGGFVIVVSIIRLKLIWNINENQLDMTWHVTTATIWSGVEMNIAIVCACLPCLRPLLNYVMTGSFSKSIASDARWPQGASGNSDTQTSERSRRFNWLDLGRSRKRPMSTTLATADLEQFPVPKEEETSEDQSKGIMVVRNWDVESQPRA